MSGLINYVSCAALSLGLLIKLPDLVRHWREPALRAINAVLALASLCFLFGAPPTVRAINDLSGVPNLAAPLTYISITAYGAASLVLIAHWRAGSDARRTTRRWVCGYAAVVVAIAVMFVIGRADRERRTDFDTYYSATPWIAEMIVLYLVAHLTAVTVTSLWSLRWARQVRRRPWLRGGLLIMGFGTLITTGYSLSKLIAVVARWSGQDLSMLSTTIAPVCAGVGAFLTTAGVLVPLAGPRLTELRQSRRDYVRLAPLERELDEVLTRRALRVPRPFSPFMWLIWRQSSILNGLRDIEEFYDRRLYDRAYAAELHTTGDPERATSTAWAVTVAAAAEHSGTPNARPLDTADRLSRTPEPTALGPLADALAASDAVAAFRVRSPLPGPALTPAHPEPAPTTAGGAERSHGT
ncbi:MAB_1171c family putative transporter [Streptomyces sp. NPDC002514]|uniref:MAB_1171c family putative transporter n=1 Tax=unclassified Streptomyces TaxID=2593676 RepID=UPI003698BD76